MYLPSVKTAIHRPTTRPSAPVQWLIDAGLFWGRVIDWGCGRSWDFWYIEDCPEVDSCDRYDPYFAPENPVGRYDVIYCGYVANTLPPTYRAGLYMDILQYMDKHTRAYIVVRADDIDGEPMQDGYMTQRGTFQRSYTPDQLRTELEEYFDWIQIFNRGHYLIAEVGR